MERRSLTSPGLWLLHSFREFNAGPVLGDKLDPVTIMDDSIEETWRQWKCPENDRHFFQTGASIFGDLAATAVEVSDDLAHSMSLNPKSSRCKPTRSPDPT